MSVAHANRQLLRKLLVVAAGMFAFGFALVPIYKKICEATGLYDLSRADAVRNTQVDATRTVTVEFDVPKSIATSPGNGSAGLAWARDSCSSTTTCGARCTCRG